MGLLHLTILIGRGVAKTAYSTLFLGGLEHDEVGTLYQLVVTY